MRTGLYMVRHEATENIVSSTVMQSVTLMRVYSHKRGNPLVNYRRVNLLPIKLNAFTVMEDGVNSDAHDLAEALNYELKKGTGMFKFPKNIEGFLALPLRG